MAIYNLKSWLVSWGGGEQQPVMHIDEMIATVVCLCTCVHVYVHMCKVAKHRYIRVHEHCDILHFALSYMYASVPQTL